MTQNTDLVERCVRRDEEAFGELYRLHSTRVFRHALYLVGDRSEAEDLTSEAFLSAWKAIDRYEDRGLPIETWLLRIARNAALTRLRKDSRLLDRGADLEREHSRGPTTECLVESLCGVEELKRALNRLPELQRKIIVWRFFDELSCREVAGQIQRTEGAVRVLQFRALRRLRAMLRGGPAEAALSG
jgi:RNA polymerase sigma-70 factor (ECF subfamily)